MDGTTLRKIWQALFAPGKPDLQRLAQRARRMEMGYLEAARKANQYEENVRAHVRKALEAEGPMSRQRELKSAAVQKKIGAIHNRVAETFQAALSAIEVTKATLEARQDMAALDELPKALGQGEFQFAPEDILADIAGRKDVADEIVQRATTALRLAESTDRDVTDLTALVESLEDETLQGKSEKEIAARVERIAEAL